MHFQVNVYYMGGRQGEQKVKGRGKETRGLEGRGGGEKNASNDRGWQKTIACLSYPPADHVYHNLFKTYCNFT